MLCALEELFNYSFFINLLEMIQYLLSKIADNLMLDMLHYLCCYKDW